MSLHLRAPLAATTAPVLLGHSRSGRPIYSVAGGDQRADLLARRDAIAERLNDPALSAEDTDALVTEAEEVRTAITAYNTQATRASEARAALLAGEPVEQRNTPTPTTPTRTPAVTRDREPDPQEQVRAGRVLVESEGFQAFRARGGSGQFAIDLPGSVRALITTDSLGFGPGGSTTRVPDRIMANEDRAPRLADLIDRRPVNTTSIEYVQEDVVSNTPGEVAEGGLKPESTWTMKEEVAPVRTIAHFTNITRQAADDDSQMVAYVEGRLGYGLETRLDQQILLGNGTAPNLRGILNTTGRQVYTAPAGESPVISIRKAITLGQTSEFPPDTVVLHPVDWERVELSTDSQGMFRVSPNVANALAPRIWGLNVVATTVIPGTAPDPDGAGALTATVGRALVGSFRMGATLWERDGIRILMTDSHASNFTSNILTLLAEMRAGLSVWRPKAFVDVSLAA